MQFKKTKKRSVNVPNGWMLMMKESVGPDTLANMLQETGYDIEVWKEAGVLEIGIEEKVSIDLELINADLGDSFSREFVEKNQVQTIYYLTIGKDQYDRCRPAMQKIVSIIGGMICGDTEDFNPVMK